MNNVFFFFFQSSWVDLCIDMQLILLDLVTMLCIKSFFSYTENL